MPARGEERRAVGEVVAELGPYTNQSSVSLDRVSIYVEHSLQVVPSHLDAVAG